MTTGITIHIGGNYHGGDNITFNYCNRLTGILKQEITKEEVLQLVGEDIRKNPMYLISHPSEIEKEIRDICAPYLSVGAEFNGMEYEKIKTIGRVEFGILTLPDDMLTRYACIATDHEKEFQGVLAYEGSSGEATESIHRFIKEGFRMSYEWIFEGVGDKE